MVSKFHIFIIPHAMEFHIPPSSVRSRPDSLANKRKIRVIFTCICVFVNKLFKIKYDIPYGYMDRISSAISPTILLLYRIHLIFQILVCPRQQLELLAYGSQLESYISVLCRWFIVFRHSLNLQNLVTITKYTLTPLVYHKKKIKAFHSNKLTMPFTSQFAFFWFFRNWNQ